MLGAAWRKSSYSAYNGNCAEVAALPDGGVGVRDSKDTAGPVLVFGPAAWREFTGRVKGSEG